MTSPMAANITVPEVSPTTGVAADRP